MSSEPPPSSLSLSPKAFEELREIVRDEYGETTADQEIHEMGTRLLRLFNTLLVSDSKDLSQAGTQGPLTEKELKVLEFIKHSMKEKRRPSVRGISRAMGLRSSRSGFRLLRSLIGRGLVYRGQKGELRIIER